MITFALGLFLAPQQGAQAIWDRLSFDAEGRMGIEATFDNVDDVGNEVDDRYRGRARFRFGAHYALTEELDLHGRLSTASDGNDANNPFWDWGDGDGFNGSEVVVDRFYLDWIPEQDFRVLAGKQPHIFTSPPIYGEFVWDSDVSPAGIGASWMPERSGDETAFDARVAAYVATEVADDEDPKMLGAQGNMYLPVEEAAMQISTALYDWKDNNDTAVAGNQGNSTTSEDFFVWDTFVSGTMPGGPLEEMTGYVEYIKNLDESDDGIVLGAQLGSSRWERGNYNAYLLLYDLDGDALFSPVAQDDTPVAGTGLNDGDGDGMSGAVLGGTYFWRENIALRLWVLTSDASGADDDPLRVRFDLDFKL